MAESTSGEKVACSISLIRYSYALDLFMLSVD